MKIGSQTVHIEKNVSNLTWSVKDNRGRVTWRIRFVAALEESSTKHISSPSEYSDMFMEVLEACMVACPLTEEDLQLVYEKYPSLQGRELRYVDEDVWELVESKPEPKPASKPNKKKIITGRKLML